MSAKRSGGRSKAKGPPHGFFVLAGLAALAVAAYFVAPRIVHRGVHVPHAPKSVRESGDKIRAALGDPADPAAAGRVLRRAIEQGIQDAGLSCENLREKPQRGRSDVSEWEIPAPSELPLLQLNLAITRSIERSGGAVLDGYEEDGQGVCLVVGTSERPLHRILLKRAENDEDVKPEGSRRLALVIEDEGNGTLAVLERFLQLGIPITVAVRPGSPSARGAAERAHAVGAEVLLHLPMEPKGYPRVDPGKDAILVDLKEGEIRRRIARNLASLPPVDGVSSYMGSLATQDRRIMSAVLEELKHRGLFFLDSRTTLDSVAPEEARRVGIPCLVNGVFLDDGEGDDAWIDDRLKEAAGIAQARGSVIITGHARSATAQALSKALPSLRRQGFEFVIVSALLAEREGAVR